jgi:hypothetical protein
MITGAIWQLQSNLSFQSTNKKQKWQRISSCQFPISRFYRRTGCPSKSTIIIQKLPPAALFPTKPV